MLHKYIFPPKTQQITNIFSEASFLFTELNEKHTW